MIAASNAMKISLMIRASARKFALTVLSDLRVMDILIVPFKSAHPYKPIHN